MKKKRKVELEFYKLEKKTYLHLKKKNSYIVKESSLREIWVFETPETVAQIKKKIKESVKESEYEDAGEYYHDIFEFDCTESPRELIDNTTYYEDEWFDVIIPDRDFKRIGLNEEDDRWKMLQDIKESGEYDLENTTKLLNQIS